MSSELETRTMNKHGMWSPLESIRIQVQGEQEVMEMPPTNPGPVSRHSPILGSSMLAWSRVLKNEGGSMICTAGVQSHQFCL